MRREKQSENPKKTILLVEDEAIIAMSEGQKLEKIGYKVITAYSGAEAVKTALSSKEIDLILMDIDLGSEMDGTVAAEKILDKKYIPILFLSSHTEPEIVEKTEKITSYGYVVKNSGITVLDASIKMAFKLFNAQYKEQMQEKALVEREECFQILSELRSDYAYSYLVDEEKNITHEWAVGSFEKISGYSPEELQEKGGWPVIMMPEDTPQILERINRQLSGETVESTLRIRTREGKIRWINDIGTPVWDKEHKRIIRILGSARDVTEKKMAEEELAKAYEENRCLLKELQHRAKNSFTMITGMIELAANSSENPAARSALNEIELRVSAVAEMYNMLYSSDTGTEVRLDDYLARLTSKLSHSPGKIILSHNLEPCITTIKTAIALGIIVTELITNAIKHAFPGDRTGRITLEFKQKEEGINIIEVIDDGQGLPADFNLPRPETLGLKLVEALTSQINGRFRLERQKQGTRGIVEFSI